MDRGRCATQPRETEASRAVCARDCLCSGPVAGEGAGAWLGKLWIQDERCQLHIHEACHPTDCVSTVRKQDHRHAGQGHYRGHVLAMPRMRGDLDHRGPCQESCRQQLRPSLRAGRTYAITALRIAIGHGRDSGLRRPRADAMSTSQKGRGVCQSRTPGGSPPFTFRR